MPCRYFFLILLFIATFPIPLSHAEEDYTGRWYSIISGQSFTLDLTQRGTVIQGIMMPTAKNERHISIISGNQHGKIIELFANNKDLSVVYHFYGGLIGKGKTQALVGNFTRNNRRFNQWHAIRYEKRSYYGSPNMNYSIFHSSDSPPTPF
ncbi:MAG TPA: hypothetical protein ENJ30_07240 [Desulfobulbaceae bacterium]|nr:hypothetical protein [Desulfobulbaceae bacterium]